MFLLKVPHYIKATYIRAKVPNSFSKRMKLLHTLIEHVMLKEGKREKVDKLSKRRLIR